MPWRLDRNGEPRCTNCKTGYVPCPVDHQSQPPNDQDEFGPFFFCPVCDWTTTGENNPDGTIACPECLCYERKDTYEGDFTEHECEVCEKKGAKSIGVPLELANNPDWVRYGDVALHDKCRTELIDEMRADLDTRPCPTCGTIGVRLYAVPELLRTTKQLRKDPYRYACPACQAGFLQQLQAKQDAWNAQRSYLDGGGFISTCDGCGKRTETEFTPPDTWLCAGCGGHPHAAPERYPTAAALYVVDDRDEPSDPPRGWYDDPEYAGYLRWWSGERWSGGPTLPEHACAS